MDYQIRQANGNDIESIIPLWRELFLIHEPMNKSFEMDSDAEIHYYSYLKTIIESQNRSEAFLFVAVTQSERRIVGYIMGMRHKSPPVFKTKEYGSIYDICVTQQYRRQEIGKNLVIKVIQWCHELDIERIEIHAATENSVALKFWKKMGFTTYMEKMYYTKG
jgi:ribosomal protein S18 acetylase RimI-like enzyme